MSIARSSTEIASRSPHSVSLKVLRLSKPTLSVQYPLPSEQEKHGFNIDPKAALAYPSAAQDEEFILSSGLRLPAAFGSAHVGETFSCTLCVNNELPADSEVDVTDIQITADMETPAQPGAPVPLDVAKASEAAVSLAPAETLQGIVQFHLGDEGNYVLAVTVTYTELQKRSGEDGDAEEVPPRLRTFRKLYQFPATQLIRIRIKTRPLPTLLERTHGQGYAVEAQLEKLGDDSLILEAATLNAKSAFEVRSLNDWDGAPGSDGKPGKPSPMLNPGDVLQAAFLLLQKASGEQDQEFTKDGRVILGQMAIQWRGAMGEAGQLNTGWLSARR